MLKIMAKISVWEGWENTSRRWLRESYSETTIEGESPSLVKFIW